MTIDMVGTLNSAIIGRPPLLPPTKKAAAMAATQNMAGSVISADHQACHSLSMVSNAPAPCSVRFACVMSPHATTARS